MPSKLSLATRLNVPATKNSPSRKRFVQSQLLVTTAARTGAETRGTPSGSSVNIKLKNKHVPLKSINVNKNYNQGFLQVDRQPRKTKRKRRADTKKRANNRGSFSINSAVHRSNLVNKNVIFKQQHTPLGLDRSTVLDLQAAGSRQIAIMRKEAKKAMKTNVDGHSYQPLDAVFLKGSENSSSDSRLKSSSLFSYTPSPLESSDSSSSSYTNSFRKSCRKKMTKTRSGRNVHRRTSSRSGKKTKKKYTAGLVEDEDDIDSDDDFVDSPDIPKKNIIERTTKISQYVFEEEDDDDDDDDQEDSVTRGESGFDDIPGNAWGYHEPQISKVVMHRTNENLKNTVTESDIEEDYHNGNIALSLVRPCAHHPMPPSRSVTPDGYSWDAPRTLMDSLRMKRLNRSAWTGKLKSLTQGLNQPIDVLKQSNLHACSKVNNESDQRDSNRNNISISKNNSTGQEEGTIITTEVEPSELRPKDPEETFERLGVSITKKLKQQDSGVSTTTVAIEDATFSVEDHTVDDVSTSVSLQNNPPKVLQSDSDKIGVITGTSRRSKRRKKPTKLTSDLQGMVNENIITESEAWKMMGSDTEIDVANDNVDEAGSGLAKDNNDNRSARITMPSTIDGLDEDGLGTKMHSYGEQGQGTATIYKPTENIEAEFADAMQPSTQDNYDGQDGNEDVEEVWNDSDDGWGDPVNEEAYNGTDDLMNDEIDENYDDLPSARPQHFEHLPFLRTVDDILNGVTRLPPCVDGTCSVCNNSTKNKSLENVIHCTDFRSQVSHSSGSRKRSASAYQPKYKHLNKKKRAKTRRRSSSTRGGRKRRKSTRSYRGRKSTKSISTARRKNNTSELNASTELSRRASARGFHSNFMTGAANGGYIVSNDNPEFNTTSAYDNNADDISAGAIIWEGAGSMGMSGV